MENNGLKLLTIRSEVPPIQSFDNFREKLGELITIKSYTVVYLDYKVLIGTYSNGIFYFYQGETFEDKFIQKIRVFNENEEFYAWRRNGRLKARYRTDLKGTEIEAIDAYQLLFGTDSVSLDGHTKIWEERGTELILPFPHLGIDIKKDNKKRIFLKTRNYIQFHDEIKQASYFDCRFIGFSSDQNTLLKIEE